MNPKDDVTRILNALEAQADPCTAEELLPLVYQELRVLARSRMSQEAAGQNQTLQATALVHEAYVRLVDAPLQTWNNRGHFFAAAAEAMRRILIERARKRNALKRGGDWERVDLDGADIAMEMKPDQLIAVDEALAALEKKDEEAAKLVKLRFYTGLKLTEIAEVLGVSERSAHRIWAYARTRLYRNLKEGNKGIGSQTTST